MDHKNKTQFAIWEQDGADELGYWLLHGTLDDAVHQYKDGVEVFEMTPKLLGTFKREAKVVRVKNKKENK